MLKSNKNRKQRTDRLYAGDRAIKPKTRVLPGLKIILFKQHSFTQNQTA